MPGSRAAPPRDRGPDRGEPPPCERPGPPKLADHEDRDPLRRQHDGPEQRRGSEHHGTDPQHHRSVVVGDRCVNSTSSTPNGSSHVTNVVATPYPTRPRRTDGVDMSASRAIDQRKPGRDRAAERDPLARGGSDIVDRQRLPKVVPSSSRRMMSARVTRSNTPSPTRAATTRRHRAHLRQRRADGGPLEPHRRNQSRSDRNDEQGGPTRSPVVRARPHGRRRRRGRSIVPAGSF